jgi:hypothetical protein
MSRYILAATAAFGFLALMPSESKAVTCAEGVYRAGCAGPNGAAAVNNTPARVYHRPPATVTCANGVYRAGCAGPNGAAVVRKPE